PDQRSPTWTLRPLRGVTSTPAFFHMAIAWGRTARTVGRSRVWPSSGPAFGAPCKSWLLCTTTLPLPVGLARACCIVVVPVQLLENHIPPDLFQTVMPIASGVVHDFGSPLSVMLTWRVALPSIESGLSGLVMS